MLAKSKTCAVVGLDGYLVEVEVDISPGLPAFTIVGLPDTAVQGVAGAGTLCHSQLRFRVPHAPYHGESSPR